MGQISETKPIAGAPWTAWGGDVHDLLNAVAAGAFVTVGSNNLPAAQKRACTYVCDGTNDQAQINAAIAQVAADRDAPQGGVYLVGSRFSIEQKIVIKANTALVGFGWGTSLDADGNNDSAMIENETRNDNGIRIANLSLWGDYAGGGSCHGIRLFGSDGGDGTFNAHPSAHPDMLPQIENVHALRFTGGVRHGFFMDDNVRGATMTGCRVTQASGHGFFMDGASDGKYTQCNSSLTGSGYAGFKVAGGSNQFVNCKSFYSDSIGFDVSSSRATMTLCQAQDAGTEGFRITGSQFMGTHLKADSGSRLSSSAWAFHISSDGAMVNGLKAVDRNQTPASRQDRGVDFNSSSDVMVMGMVETPNGTNEVTGTPSGYVRVVREGGSLYSVG